MYLTNQELDHIIHLASSAKQAYLTYMQACFPQNNVTPQDYWDQRNEPEAIANRAADRALTDFMNQLDYEAILDLEALMFYGRDLYENKGIEHLRRHPEAATGWAADLLHPQEQFVDARTYCALQHPWEGGKPDAIQYLTDKLPLCDYLRCAQEALQM